MTSRWEWALGSLAWFILGIVATLSVQRGIIWWRKRHELPAPKPMKTTTYLISLLVLFSVVAALFSQKAQLGEQQTSRDFRAQVKCQNQINEKNVSAENTRSKLNAEDKDGLVDLFKSVVLLLSSNDPNLKQDIQGKISTYDVNYDLNNKIRLQNPIESTASCS